MVLLGSHRHHWASVISVFLVNDSKFRRMSRSRWGGGSREAWRCHRSRWVGVEEAFSRWLRGSDIPSLACMAVGSQITWQMDRWQFSPGKTYTPLVGGSLSFAIPAAPALYGRGTPVVTAAHVTRANISPTPPERPLPQLPFPVWQGGCWVWTQMAGASLKLSTPNRGGKTSLFMVLGPTLLTFGRQKADPLTFITETRVWHENRHADR